MGGYFENSAERQRRISEDNDKFFAKRDQEQQAMVEASDNYDVDRQPLNPPGQTWQEIANTQYVQESRNINMGLNQDLAQYSALDDAAKQQQRALMHQRDVAFLASFSKAASSQNGMVPSSIYGAIGNAWGINGITAAGISPNGQLAGSFVVKGLRKDANGQVINDDILSLSVDDMNKISNRLHNEGYNNAELMMLDNYLWNAKRKQSGWTDEQMEKSGFRNPNNSQPWWDNNGVLHGVENYSIEDRDRFERAVNDDANRVLGGGRGVFGGKPSGDSLAGMVRSDGRAIGDPAVITGAQMRRLKGIHQQHSSISAVGFDGKGGSTNYESNAETGYRLESTDHGTRKEADEARKADLAAKVAGGKYAEKNAIDREKIASRERSLAEERQRKEERDAAILKERQALRQQNALQKTINNKYKELANCYDEKRRNDLMAEIANLESGLMDVVNPDTAEDHGGNGGSSQGGALSGENDGSSQGGGSVSEDIVGGAEKRQGKITGGKTEKADYRYATGSVSKDVYEKAKSAGASGHIENNNNGTEYIIDTPSEVYDPYKGRRGKGGEKTDDFGNSKAGSEEDVENQNIEKEIVKKIKNPNYLSKKIKIWKTAIANTYGSYDGENRVHLNHLIKKRLVQEFKLSEEDAQKYVEYLERSDAVSKARSKI